MTRDFAVDNPQMTEMILDESVFCGGSRHARGQAAQPADLPGQIASEAEHRCQWDSVAKDY
jgi:hypothetical protein